MPLTTLVHNKLSSQLSVRKFQRYQFRTNQEKRAPDVGLEPTTVGLKVQRSTD